MQIRSSLIEILEKLIAYPTVSKESNLELIKFINDFLNHNGISSEIIYNDLKTKANLFATIGPMVRGGVVLSGHTDVVPVEQQKWKTEPFLLKDNGNIYTGRGTADMKSFIATSLAFLPEMTRSSLKAPIHLAFSYDEEVGCIGVPSMIKFIKEKIPHPKAIIVGEPTNMKVVSAHKGVTGLTIEVKGKEAHSSQTHLGVSAVMVAGEIINFVSELNKENILYGRKDKNFHPDHSTLTVNTVQGGSALNILAGYCKLSLDVRSLPNEKPEIYVNKIISFCKEKLLTKIRETSTDCEININIIASTPALKYKKNSEAEILSRSITGDNQIRSVSFAAEAGQFQEAKMETIICGPGSIEQAHQPDEYIKKEQIILCQGFISKLINRLS